jgi:hypothetical protein
LFVTDRLIPYEGVVYTKDLLASEASCYSYFSNSNQGHGILQGEYATALPATHIQVSGVTETVPAISVRASAFDWTNLVRGIENLVMKYYPNLEAANQAQYLADALLRTEAQKALGGQITIPPNVGQELFDVITITDERVHISNKKFRVAGIKTDFSRKDGKFEQQLTLSAP